MYLADSIHEAAAAQVQAWADTAVLIGQSAVIFVSESCLQTWNESNNLWVQKH
jgi:hypothetical protein